MGNSILEKFASRSRFWVFVLILLTCSVALAIGSQDDLRITNSLSVGAFAAPDASSIFDVHSTTQGVLLPRMTNTQLLGISTPREGLIGYDLTNHELSIYDGSQWQKMFDAGNLTGTLPAGSIPGPTPTTLGGVFSNAGATHNFLTSIATDGTVSKARPACGDLSDSGAGCSTAGVSINTPSTLVLRDGSGNFAAGTITATVVGNALSPAYANVGDILYANGTPFGAWNNTVGVASASGILSGAVLILDASSGLPTWETPAAASLGGNAWPIATGGTGQATKAAAFDALSPLAATGDILTYSTTNVRLGTVLADAGKFLASGGGSASNFWTYDGEFLTNLNASNVTSGTLPIARGGTNNGSLAVTAGGVLYTDGSKLVNVGAGTAGQALKSNGSSAPTWGTVASTGSVNFISNPDAETDTTGYATYSNTAQALPVTGTGGSPTVTWTRTTSTPLTQTGSFLFTKDAANRQGQGASYDFVVDNASAAKVMSIDFDYEVASGTFVAGASGVDSDIEIYVYDISNGVVIQPSGPSTYKLFSNSSTIPTHFTTTFQTASNSTSYRLIFHVATTSASAYTVKFDSISVAPAKYVYGSPITDPIAYTPTFSAGLGTVTNVNYHWRRTGSYLEVYGTHTVGTVAASAATISLPAGLVIDNSFTTVTSVGDYVIGQLNASSMGHILASAGGTVVSYGGTTNSPTTQSFLTAQNGSAVGASTVTHSVYFKVPILGWSSSVQMSDSASQTGIAFRGTLSQSITGAAAAASLTLTSTYDTVGAYSGSTYTVQSPGKYRISGVYTSPSLAWSSTNVMYLAYSINGGSNVIFARQATPAFTAAIYASGTDTVDLKSGDTIVFKGYSDVTGTFTGEMSIEKQASPVSIAATDTVAAKMQGTTGATYTSAGITTVPYNAIAFDNTGMCSTSTSKCTAPIQGKYRICGGVSVSGGTQTLGNTYNLYDYVNGSQKNSLGGGFVAQASAAFTVITGGCTSESLNAGDVVDLRYSGTSTGTLTFGSGTVSQYFSIERINGAGG